MSRRRVHEHEVAIQATPKAVWKALTDAAAIAGWVGFDGGDTDGFIRSAFLDHVASSEDGRHLICGDRSGHFIEFFLAPGEGTTQLRMVHSGELEGSDWDGIYDSEYVGWKGYLVNLRHYLERHEGVAKRSFHNGALTRLAPAEAFEVTSGPQGLGFEEPLIEMAPGRRFQTRTAGGDLLAGRVHTRIAGASGCSLRVENLDDALLHLSSVAKGHEYRIARDGRAAEDGNTYESRGGQAAQTQVALVLNTWGLDGSTYEGIRSRTREWFTAIFPPDVPTPG